MDVEESLWSLDEEDDAQGRPAKMLMITLVKPPLSEDEVLWKKGAPQTCAEAGQCYEISYQGMCLNW